MSVTRDHQLVILDNYLKLNDGKEACHKGILGGALADQARKEKNMPII